ncbi:MAG TPA: hypothetical protein VHV78_16970, partial [Gemmatimonadaceae bacterium]|nr:hypothetical protein [Gemmatimonadaceae bacterium]
MTTGIDHDPVSSPLRELAAQVGIVPEYHDLAGAARVTSDATRRSFLAALGIEASTDTAARDALARARNEQREEMIPPVRVVRAVDPTSRILPVRSPLRATAGRWWLEVDPEDEEPQRTEGPWRAEDTGELRLPSMLKPGYHRVRLTLASNRREWMNDQTLIIVPSQCASP